MEIEKLYPEGNIIIFQTFPSSKILFLAQVLSVSNTKYKNDTIQNIQKKEEKSENN